MRFPSFHSSPPSADSQRVEHGCGFMHEMLNSLADESAHGIVRWYAEQHVAGCPYCSAALVGLKELRVRLRAFGLPALPEEETSTTTEEPVLRLLSPERRAAIAAAWERQEQD